MSMRIFKTTSGGVNLAPGFLVRLTPEQAEVRIHNLREVEGLACDGRSTYEIVNRLNFKVGEVFWYNGEVNRALLKRLDEFAVLMEIWDPSKKAEEIKNFAAMLPGFKAPTGKKKTDWVEAVEKHLAGMVAVAPEKEEIEEEQPLDLAPLDLEELYKFALDNNLDVGVDIEDRGELQELIEKLLADSEEHDGLNPDADAGTGE